MSIRPAISAPLPWLTILVGRALGKSPPGKVARLFRMPRSLSFTREGRWFVAILFAVGIAAINTGNNLLYLVVATLLSLIVISGVMSESTLRGLRVTRTLPRMVFKGAPVIVRYRTLNHKRLLPSFSFTIREMPAGGIEAAPSYIVKLGPGGEAASHATVTFKRRGAATLEGIRVSTRFPFGLFLKGKREEASEEVVVYPSVRPARTRLEAAADARPGDGAAAKKGDGTDTYGFREHAPGDDSRLIHWLSSARAGRLLVREFERGTQKRATVVFDNCSTADENAFEDAVDEAASVAARLIGLGYAVGLKTLTAEVPRGRTQTHLERILHALALISPARQEGRPSVRVST